MDSTEEIFYYCSGCLSLENESAEYRIQSEALKNVFQVQTLRLCYICKKILQRSDQFILNVLRNQIYLENFSCISGSSTNMGPNCQPLINLSRKLLDVIEFTNESEESEISIEHFEIKHELKREISVEPLDIETMDDSDNQETLKDEDSLSDSNEDYKEPDHSKLKRKNIAKKDSLKNVQKKEPFMEKGAKKDKDPFIIVVQLTNEEFLEERRKMQDNPKYKNAIYKCDDCIKGFNFKEKYDRHMEAHSKVMGEYVCDICKRRMDSMEKLVGHKKYHEVRYKCSECGMTRLNRMTIKDHYTAFHLNNAFQHKCTLCDKIFIREAALKKHLTTVHGGKERLGCKYCDKSFANKDALNNHVMLKHPTELSEHASVMHYTCSECGAGFKMASQLKYHMVKHSDQKDFYCVECDRGFKSSWALKHHLKTASPHVNPLELKHRCEHCDKRFALGRELERHMNRFHLNRKPYQCDKCDKAYLALWSLNQHKRFSHEGHKRPLKYPCPMCDKAFSGSYARKTHIFTHTNERPYHCTHCPATFNQNSALATHVKHVHLRLARDRQPQHTTSGL